jgi:transmembrane sensor
MNTHSEDGGGCSSRRARAEAASWVARLHGPDRDAGVEAGLKRWLAQDTAHQEAFELATEVWQETAELPCDLSRLATQVNSHGRFRAKSRLPAVAWTASVVVAVLVALIFHRYQDGRGVLRTGVGEQRTLALADGTRVELNTRSELVTRYDDRTRKVILKSGEAHFDVAKQPQRPFVVVAGEHEIAALGTTFVVRQDPSGLTVTLLEGRVAVAPSSASGVVAADVRVLAPGQRLKIANGGTPVLDSPSIDKVTAWQRGQLIFEDTTLAEAAAEFNRYSERSLTLGSVELGRIRVGGTFRTGDVSSFAEAVAQSNRLTVVDRGQEIVLISPARQR